MIWMFVGFGALYVGAIGYVLLESGFVDTVRYRIRQRREDCREDD